MGMLGGQDDTASTIIVIPSRLQVFLSRELFGWPLYGIILAIGQVSVPPVVHSEYIVTIDCSADVERDQLPDRITLRFERGDHCCTVHHWRSLLRCFGLLVSSVPS